MEGLISSQCFCCLVFSLVHKKGNLLPISGLFGKWREEEKKKQTANDQADKEEEEEDEEEEECST